MFCACAFALSVVRFLLSCPSLSAVQMAVGQRLLHPKLARQRMEPREHLRGLLSKHSRNHGSMRVSVHAHRSALSLSQFCFFRAFPPSRPCLFLPCLVLIALGVHFAPPIAALRLQLAIVLSFRLFSPLLPASCLLYEPPALPVFARHFYACELALTFASSTHEYRLIINQQLELVCARADRVAWRARSRASARRARDRVQIRDLGGCIAMSYSGALYLEWLRMLMNG